MPDFWRQMALTRLDLPTLLRPIKAISGSPGSDSHPLCCSCLCILPVHFPRNKLQPVCWSSLKGQILTFAGAHARSDHTLSVRCHQKEQVRNMFDNIAPKYDLLNRMLSLGIDQYWRRSALKKTQAVPTRSCARCSLRNGRFQYCCSEVRSA